MADEVNRSIEKPREELKPHEETKQGLKSEIKSDKRKLIIYSELLKPKF